MNEKNKKQRWRWLGSEISRVASMDLSVHARCVVSRDIIPLTQIQWQTFRIQRAVGLLELTYNDFLIQCNYLLPGKPVQSRGGGEIFIREENSSPR